MSFDNNLNLNDTILPGTKIKYDDNFKPNTKRIATGQQLYIQTPFVIQIQPTGGNFCTLFGDVTTTLYCLANSGVTYKWQRANLVGGTFIDINEGGAYSGTNTNTMVIDNNLLPTNCSYAYRCKIQGSVYTNEITVNVGDGIILNGMTYSYSIGPTSSGNLINFSEDYHGTATWNWQYSLAPYSTQVDITSATADYGAYFTHFNSPTMDGYDLDWRWNNTKISTKATTNYCGDATDYIILNDIPYPIYPLDGTTTSMITLAIGTDLGVGTLNQHTQPWRDRVAPSAYAYANTGVGGRNSRIGNINGRRAAYYGIATMSADSRVGSVNSPFQNMPHHDENYRTPSYSTRQLTLATLFRIDGLTQPTGYVDGYGTIFCSRSDYFTTGSLLGFNVYYGADGSGNYNLYIDSKGAVGLNQWKFPHLYQGEIYVLSVIFDKADLVQQVYPVLECVSNPTLNPSGSQTSVAINNDTYNGSSNFSPCIGCVAGFPNIPKYQSDATIGGAIMYSTRLTDDKCDDLRLWYKRQYGY